jgi:hypothetical protein
VSLKFIKKYNYRKNGIRTHGISKVYVGLANQCFKPLSHLS